MRKNYTVFHCERIFFFKKTCVEFVSAKFCVERVRQDKNFLFLKEKGMFINCVEKNS